MGSINLPHEQELSKRRSSMLLDIPKELEVSNDVLNSRNDTASVDHGLQDEDSLESSQDEMESQANQKLHAVKKQDILVDSFQEWRSTRHGIDDSIQSSIYSPKSCCICMAKYKHGDDICWSQNERCYHAFHLECMLEWLMKHNECPMCRRNYLRSEVSNHDDDNVDANVSEQRT